MAEQVKTKGGKRAFVGIVTSDKMDKTIVVSINTKKIHVSINKTIKL